GGTPAPASRVERMVAGAQSDRESPRAVLPGGSRTSDRRTRECESSLLRSLGLGVTLYAFWLVLSGHYTPMLMSLGAGSCALAVYMAHRMNVVDQEGLPLHIAFRFVLYLPWLLKEIFLSNVTMARIDLDPKLPIAPKLGRYRLPYRTDLGRVIYPNS